MKLISLLFTVVILCTTAVNSVAASYKALPAHGKKLKVAVYNNGRQFKQYGVNYIYEALKKAPGINVETIDNLASATLKKYDTVVISTVKSLAKKDHKDSDRGVKGTDWIKTLTNYVDCGGGLVFGHNAVGFRGIFGTYQLFPMIGTSQKRNLKTGFKVTDATHPVMKNMPTKFRHRYDHMEINPGNIGKTLAVDELGKPMVVAGDVSRGRVVQIGIPFGIYWRDKTGALPKTDKQLLLNAVKWAGAKTKYAVPMAATEAGLLVQSKGYKAGLQKAELAKYRNLPAPKFDEAVIWLPGYWVMPGQTKFAFNSEKIVNRVMDDCKRMGFTKVMMIAKAGYYLYPTELDTTEEKRGCRDGFSPIGALSKAAKARGMKVAMILFPFKSSLEWDKYAPNITKKEYAKLKSGKLKLSDIDAKRKWARGSCPDHPAVRARAMKITEELIRKYDPDELNVDFIRYKDGYDTGCYCDYSRKRHAEFAAKHPELAANKVVKKFSEASISSFVVDWVKLCKKLKPSLKTSCYTISAPGGARAPKWVKRFPVDYHCKYVSRHTSGPESTLTDVAKMSKFYSDWVKSANLSTQFSPIIATYDPKSAERILAEFKIVSDFQTKEKLKFRRVEFYVYGLLVKDKKNMTLDPEMVKGITEALTGK